MKSASRKKKAARPPKRRRAKPRRNPADGFIAVARRLEADEDKATFEAKLGKIARARV